MKSMNKKTTSAFLLGIGFFVYVFYTVLSLNTLSGWDEWWVLWIVRENRDNLLAGNWGQLMWMVESYVGAFNGFISIPFDFLGYGLEGMRVTGIVFTGLGLLCVFETLRRVFSSPLVGALVVFLVCTNVSFLNAVPLWVFREEITQVNLLWGGILFFVLWWNSRKALYALLCAAFWGLALWAKIMFAAYFLAFCMVVFLFFAASPGKVCRGILANWKILLACVFVFCLAALPGLISYFSLFAQLLSRVTEQATYDDGWNSLGFAGKLLVRCKHFWLILVHDANTLVIDVNLMVCRNYVQAVWFLVAFVWVVPRAFVRWVKSSFSSLKDLCLVFCACGIVCVVVFSVFVPAGICSGHLLMAIPMVQVISVVFLVELAGVFARFFRHGKLVLGLFLVLCVLPDAFSMDGQLRLNGFMAKRYAMAPLADAVCRHPGVPVLDFRLVKPWDLEVYMATRKIPGADFKLFDHSDLKNLPTRFFVLTHQKKEYENMPAILALYLSGGVWDESFVDHMREYDFRVLEKWQVFYNIVFDVGEFTYLYLVEVSG